MDIKIPKFRTTHRLVLWMKNNWVCIHDYDTNKARLPSDREEVFFKSKKESPSIIACNVSEYAFRTGKLEPRFEELLKCEPSAVLRYAKILHSRQEEVSEDLLNCFKGKNSQLFGWAQTIGRLPSFLEDTFDDPKHCFFYAQQILRGRLPSQLEGVFFKDAFYASKYAFEVIRGFSSVRLPEELHNFMIMKSFEDPDNKYVKAYIEASENDPGRMGNSVVRV
jgi:hypothetical protein